MTRPQLARISRVEWSGGQVRPRGRGSVNKRIDDVAGEIKFSGHPQVKGHDEAFNYQV